MQRRLSYRNRRSTKWQDNPETLYPDDAHEPHIITERLGREGPDLPTAHKHHNRSHDARPPPFGDISGIRPHLENELAGSFERPANDYLLFVRF